MIPTSRRLHYTARVSILLIAVALVTAMAGCNPFCRLTIDSTEGGSVTTPGEGTFSYFVPQCCPTQELVAEADEGYRFVEWTGYVDNPDAAITYIVIGCDESITAHFEPECTPMIAAGGLHTIGLKDNGRVFALGDNSYGQCNVVDWRGIDQTAAGGSHTVGLKPDGTVVGVGRYGYRQWEVGGWRDIAQVAAGWYHTVGLMSDGTIVAVGNNDEGQCDVGWTGILPQRIN